MDRERASVLNKRAGVPVHVVLCLKGICCKNIVNSL